MLAMHPAKQSNPWQGKRGPIPSCLGVYLKALDAVGMYLSYSDIIMPRLADPVSNYAQGSSR
jgi:hypothetical protein